jgi:hypothetical protein
MKLLGWQKLVKNKMRGFVDVEVTVENGRTLGIYGCLVHVGPNGPWVALRAKTQVDKDGTVRRKLATGRIEYGRILKWNDKATSDKFSAAVIKLLLARHPDALDAEDGP